MRPKEPNIIKMLEIQSIVDHSISSHIIICLFHFIYFLELNFSLNTEDTLDFTLFCFKIGKLSI